MVVPARFARTLRCGVGQVLPLRCDERAKYARPFSTAVLAAGVSQIDRLALRFMYESHV